VDLESIYLLLPDFIVLQLPSMALDPRFPAGMTNNRYSVNKYLTLS